MIFSSSLKDKFIVLASSSPRRIDILKKLDIPIQVIPSKFPENLDKSQFPTPEDYVLRNATEKGKEVYQRLFSKEELPDLIISADTIVSFQNKILEKPSSKENAIEMLTSLSGCQHQVMTAVILIRHSNGTPIIDSFVEVTDVWFDEIPLKTIEAYVATGEPMDKAGGYGYQGIAGFFIKKIDGCYYNVVGFPTSKFFKKLNDLFP